MNEGHHTIKRYGTTVSVMLMAAVAVAVSAMFVYVKKATAAILGTIPMKWKTIKKKAD